MPMLKPCRTWFALVLLILLTGCAAGIEQSYNGPARERQQVARLVVQSPAQLRAINGDSSFDRKILAGTLMDRRQVDFLPGSYTLNLYYDNEDASTWPFGGTIKSNKGIEASVTFEPGKTYRVKSKFFPNQNLSLWIEEYQDIDEIDSDAVAARKQGSEQYNAGHYRKSLPLFQKAYGLDPNYADAYYYSGWAYIKLGQYSEAASEFLKAVRLVHRDPYNFSALGWIYYQSGDCQTAVAHYNRALIIRPDASDFFLRGYCNMKLGRTREALADFTSNIQLDGADANAYFNRALAYEKLGDRAKARQDRQAYQRMKR